VKAFECFPVNGNNGPKWVLREIEHGPDFKDVAGLPLYDSQEACEVVRMRLDAAENGDK
jgi:hypothetical protein